MLVSALEGARLWAERYDTMPNPLLALEGRLLHGIFGDLAGRVVADIACGTGRWAACLTARGAEVVGVDFCAEMLARIPPNLRGRVVLGSAEYLPIRSGMADLAICSFAAGYFADLIRAFREIARITRRGGRVLISEIHPEALRAGWTRSFRARGELYEVEHFNRPIQTMRAAAAQAGLRFEFDRQEPFGPPEAPIFASAGKQARFHEVSAAPAVWIGCWRKR